MRREQKGLIQTRMYFWQAHDGSLLSIGTRTIKLQLPRRPGSPPRARLRSSIRPLSYLVGKQEADGFQALLPPVHVVSEEEVVGLGGVAPVLEQPEEVRVLAVDVPWKGTRLEFESKIELGWQGRKARKDRNKACSYDEVNAEVLKASSWGMIGKEAKWRRSF